MISPQRHRDTENESGPCADLTAHVIGAAIEVHKALGPGLLEAVYEECLCHELSLRGIPFKRQVNLPILYKGVRLESTYRMDVVVDGCIVLELKCVDALAPVHEAQLLTYLRLSGCKVGLILNFNVRLMKDGIVRKVL